MSPTHSRRRNIIELLRDRPAQARELRLPKECHDLSDYTDERLLESLAYANDRLLQRTRVVSPIAGNWLVIIKFATKNLLNGVFSGDEQKEAMQGVVQMAERGIHGSHALYYLQTSTEDDALKRILELRRYEFVCRYGDYMATLANHLRKLAKTFNIKEFALISSAKYWTDINIELNREADAWNARLFRHRKIEAQEVKHHILIDKVCIQIGISPEIMREVIAAYAERNSLAHLGLAAMLRDSQISKLKKTLYNDMREIEAVASWEETEKVTAIQVTIKFFTERWFDISFQPANPEVWNVKKKLMDDMKSIQESSALAFTGAQATKLAEDQAALAAKLEPQSRFGGKRKISDDPTERAIGFKKKMKQLNEMTVRTRSMKTELQQDYGKFFNLDELE